ncbi:FG-GAP-like repeat-containing protein [Aliifodinibius salicampi]|uniref:FG-GAP-like repeat-containing protein n=1 Tax=Fodinibius salicampi TaxID=1920655 RepID=A0ABT3PWI5_9BACT|nr:FG-GAP-like repeat-containing protein [Fodinibius salicampi]MCW9712210.1 FG-GAP-like repeat-containing protein [Fodinibius salicampi]
MRNLVSKKGISIRWIYPVILGILFSACTSTPPSKPDVESDEYRQAVSDFYVSLTAMQSDQVPFAVEKMDSVATIYPAEPAAWANLGVYAMRQGDFDGATEKLNEALKRSSDDADIQFLAGILESRKGNIEASLEHLGKAARLDSTNGRILFALAEELERQDSEENAQEIIHLLDQILEEHPDNLAVLLEKIRTAAKSQNQSVMEQSLAKIEENTSGWPEQIQKQFAEHKSEILNKEGSNITFELAFLRNTLSQLPRFQHDVEEVELPTNQVGFLITEFRWLPKADHIAAPIDKQLSFTAVDTVAGQSAQLYKSVTLADEEQASTIRINSGEAIINKNIAISFPGESGSDRLPSPAVTSIDYNYDFLSDFVFTGSAGLKIYRQEEDSTFTDATSTLGIPSEVINKSYYGSWVIDIELDGDLDLLLSAVDGSSVLLRNNGDDTFEVQSYFEESKHIRNVLWADFDRDGDPDVVTLSQNGDLHFYRNERAGEYHLDQSFDLDSPVQSISFGDLNSDGAFEIISLQSDQIVSSSYVDSIGGWGTEPLTSLKDSVKTEGVIPQLHLADLDNNGALDLLLSNNQDTQYWLSNENVELTSEATNISGYIYSVSDLDGDSRLDLLGLNEENQSMALKNSGNSDYKGRILQPRVARQSGDRRINSFGIGGEVESRSGLQYIKQPITQPWVHLGLGNYEEAEVVRVNWPNGTTQSEFAELGFDSQILNEQILKGSCPWIMTYNGEKMQFVTDFLWRTALGLRINRQGVSQVIHSIDWVKIEDDQLKPKDGYYDIRITADLWETHFFDHVSLMAVDHPEDIDVFVDERFKLPPPEQKLYPIRDIAPVQTATDWNGNDVTTKIREKEGEYVDDLPLTSYQGVTEEHYLEVDLGQEVPIEEKIKLIAAGWVYPTDTSINIAISQNENKSLHGIRVEVPNGSGGWKVVHTDIGFPSGKSKTMLVDLEDVFEPNTEHKVRLYTNMEIYWDQIRWGIYDEDIELQTKKLAAETSTLRYRGFSKLEQTDRFSPTVPNYQELAGTNQRWRDLEGFYTRFGDVKELIEEIDDRYVIMNAGDELLFKFPRVEEPRKGWTRDFVLIGDGWVKDGDYNTVFSKTVRPLPYHGLEEYSEEPGLLQDDPAYQKNKEDWVKYHTRFVTPGNFNTAVRLN